MAEKEEFLDKLRKMSVEELVKYENAAKFTNRMVGTLAIILILLTLFYPHIVLIVCTAITVYVLANVSAGVSDFITVVQGHLEDRDK